MALKLSSVPPCSLLAVRIASARRISSRRWLECWSSSQRRGGRRGTADVFTAAETDGNHGGRWLMTDRRASALKPGACGITASEESCTYSGFPGDTASGAQRIRSRGWRSYGCRTNLTPPAANCATGMNFAEPKHVRLRWHHGGPNAPTPTSMAPIAPSTYGWHQGFA